MTGILRRLTGTVTGLTVLAVAVVLIVAVVMVIHANAAAAQHNQEIANCTWVLHYSWAHCAKLYP